MHGKPFGTARFVNDAFKQTADRCMRERAFIIIFCISKYFRFARRLVDGNSLLLFDVANLQCAMRTLIPQFHKLLVDFIHAAPPVRNIHGATSRRDNPLRPASFKTWMRSRKTALAALGDVAFSISETRAEPTTAASACPPSKETCPGSEIPNPTAIGSWVKLRVRL